MPSMYSAPWMRSGTCWWTRSFRQVFEADSAIAATQFSAFMGATIGCEAWSTYVMGNLVKANGYPFGILILCAASFAALPLLVAFESHESRGRE